ncbi:fatty acid--CoA ligase family protein [Streptomyces sp. NPDC048191]|uniref:class I adenylate-forming enzyme family protein n=1 Tax=Streptomyces sp. NPDC048191 TaxID=3155484 RepID=UPI0033E966A9
MTNDTDGFSVEIPHSWSSHENYAFRILHRLSRTPDYDVLHWRGRDTTSGLLAAQVMKAAEVFLRCAAEKSRTIAVLTSSNHPAMLVSRYAAHLVGAGVVYIRAANPRTDADMLPHRVQSRILAETGACVLVVDAPHIDRGRSLAASAATPLTLVTADADVPDAQPLYSGRPARPSALPAYDPARRAIVTFTSGSTGQPKSLAQSFRTWNATVAAFPGRNDPERPGRILAVTPVSHTVGSMVDSVLAGGGRAVLHEGFDAAAVLRAFAGHRIEDVYLAVPHLYRLIDHEDTARTDLSSLRRLIYSGTPAAPHRIAGAVRLFGDAVIQLYGTTEAGGISSLTPLDHREPELLPTVGRPFPWVRVRICDPRTGAEVDRGRVGEVWTRSATLMDGYLGDTGCADDVLVDGWLRTGDLGHFDRYGYLRLVGRVGQVIKAGGQKVYPAAVESALLTHPEVRQAVVFGVQDPDRVEHVHAAVALTVGSTVTDAELRSHVTAALNPAHAPARFSRWAEIPLTAYGKPDRVSLRSRADGEPAVSRTAQRGTAA